VVSAPFFFAVVFSPLVPPGFKTPFPLFTKEVRLRLCPDLLADPKIQQRFFFFEAENLIGSFSGHKSK